MERKHLEDLGLTKEVIDKVLDLHSADIGKLKKQTETAIGERDTLKAQLAETVKSLEAFKGVDLEALKGEISTLKTSLTAKEAEFAAQLSERDFKDLVTEAITAAKGKNAKAISALLDTKTLKDSKNQKADVTAAVEALRKTDAYLFDGNGGTGGNGKPTFSTAGRHDEDASGKGTSTNATMNALIMGKVRGDTNNGNDD